MQCAHETSKLPRATGAGAPCFRNPAGPWRETVRVQRPMNFKPATLHPAVAAPTERNQCLQVGSLDPVTQQVPVQGNDALAPGQPMRGFRQVVTKMATSAPCSSRGGAYELLHVLGGPAALGRVLLTLNNQFAAVGEVADCAGTQVTALAADDNLRAAVPASPVHCQPHQRDQRRDAAPAQSLPTRTFPQSPTPLCCRSPTPLPRPAARDPQCESPASAPTNASAPRVLTETVMAWAGGEFARAAAG